MKKILKKSIIALGLGLLNFNVFAQDGVSITTDGTAADASAILDVKSTDKGVLFPRMTEAERDAIGTPATGLLIYQTDGESGLYNYNGSGWVQVGDGDVPQTGIIISETETNAFLTASGYTCIGRETKSFETVTPPMTESWTAMSTTGTPDGGPKPKSVWTGSKMFVWAGNRSSTTHAALFDPATNSWSPVSLINSSPGSESNSLVWTGTEVISFSGWSASGYLNGLYKYNPSTDIWTTGSVVGAPSARYYHAACWTGDKMIIWGGTSGNTGGVYDPSTDSWTTMSTTTDLDGLTAIIYTAYYFHDGKAPWTGTEMFVIRLGVPHFYNPSTDSWRKGPTCPDLHGHGSITFYHDNKILVWGGTNSTTPGNQVNIYDLGTDTWTSSTPHPSYTYNYYGTGVWTGSELIISGGNSNVTFISSITSIYNLADDSWTIASSSGMGDHYWNTSVWTGDKFIIYGSTMSLLPGGNRGRIYQPTTTGGFSSAISKTFYYFQKN